VIVFIEEAAMEAISYLLCNWRKLPANIQFFLHELSGEEGYY